MRAITIFVCLFCVAGCASITRSRVGPQVLAAYPYASDVSIPQPAAGSPIKRRLMAFAARSLRKATRRRRVHPDMDHRATIGDVLSTLLPGAAPQIR
jgi:hypothetical protein